MPHDANGNTLTEGSKVFLPGHITKLLPGEEFCNCWVELELPMPGNDTKTVLMNLNTQQMYLELNQAEQPASPAEPAASDG